MHTNWTDEQITLLKTHYETMKSDRLAPMLGKTKDQMRWKAKTYGLRKKVSRARSDCTWLEDFDDPAVNYWWGFIAADGCYSQKKELILAVHENDEAHLRLFCDRCQSNMSRSTRKNSWHQEPYTMVRTAVNDLFTMTRLEAKLDLKPRKTYNPFSLNIFMTPERLAFFVAGLTDGDGYIFVNRGGSRIENIAIKTHPAWETNYRLMADGLKRFYGIEASVHVEKKGWVVFGIRRKGMVNRLYEIVKGRVPCMERKWAKLERPKP